MLTNLLIAAFAQAVVTPLPPPPAACDPFTIFFDSGSAAIPARYEQTIDNIVFAARETHSYQIRIEGHADSSGSSSYNLKLSGRRAESVKAALIAKGFPKQGIVTSARGESNAFVETPNGAPEPENRVVTVCFD